MLLFIFQSVMVDGAVNPQQTLPDFLFSLYGGHNKKKEVLSEIGICKLNFTQLTCLLELPLANLYHCLSIFATWMEDGIYDFATLPYTIKAHLTPEDLAILKSIPLIWEGTCIPGLLLSYFHHCVSSYTTHYVIECIHLMLILFPIQSSNHE